MKLRVWCDSGANAFSCRERIISLKEETGISDEEWYSLSDDEKDAVMKDLAWDRLDWGYSEVGEDEDDE